MFITIISTYLHESSIFQNKNLYTPLRIVCVLGAKFFFLCIYEERQLVYVQYISMKHQEICFKQKTKKIIDGIR